MGLFFKNIRTVEFLFRKILRDFPKGKSHDFKSYVINKGLIGVVTAYVTYELGAAVWKAGEGQLEDGQAGRKAPGKSRKVGCGDPPPSIWLRGSGGPSFFFGGGLNLAHAEFKKILAVKFLLFFLIVALVAVACFLWFLRSFH